MFLISIFKKENRRNKERRGNGSSQKLPTERRSNQDRRALDDRREDIGRRTGLYYRLPDNQKDTLDSIINILEKKLER